MESVKLVTIFACCALVRAESTASERDAVVGMSAAGDAETLRQFSSWTCGDSSSDIEATFTNPSYPDDETAALGSCQFRVMHYSQNICQIRLDFTEFTISKPDNNGACDLDFLQITGGSSNVPVICGENTGQHMYVDVVANFCSSSSTLINVDTVNAGGSWSLKIKQIECNSFDKAPPGCLQYFTSTSGTIRSFNFNPVNTASLATSQLANQGYGVCINSQPGYCSVSYRQAAGSAFSLSGDPSALAPGMPLPGLVGTECTTDYLLVPNAQIEDTTNISPSLTSTDRFCGLSFPDVTSSIPPFNIYMVTNDGEASDGDSSNKGFELTYRMNSC